MSARNTQGEREGKHGGDPVETKSPNYYTAAEEEEEDTVTC